MSFLLLLLFLAFGVWCGRAQAKSYQTQQQALQEAFPSAKTERKTLFLTTAQVAKIESSARVKVTSRVVTYYVARSSSGVETAAYFDRAVVRTMPMTYMVVVAGDGQLDRVEILSFDEPDDYLPPQRWLRLYRGRVLNDDLNVGRGIPHITGASLTSQAVNDGVRKALAIHREAVIGAR